MTLALANFLDCSLIQNFQKESFRTLYSKYHYLDSP
ncbi:hypothetical protein SaSA73_0113 [Streptococcus agalactiae]|nr:hypothetical protein SaSA33_0114 [Streptococcus agalactiae]AUO84639.1 hypothetical protein SaSA73_0113 [Streptococcus agalactiae]